MGKCQLKDGSMKRQLTSRIKDERWASKDYLKMARKLEKKGLPANTAGLIKAISRDESRHKRVLSRISKKIC